jgi:hypothetical protein
MKRCEGHGDDVLHILYFNKRWKKVISFVACGETCSTYQTKRSMDPRIAANMMIKKRILKATQGIKLQLLSLQP